MVSWGVWLFDQELQLQMAKSTNTISWHVLWKWTKWWKQQDYHRNVRSSTVYLHYYLQNSRLKNLKSGLYGTSVWQTVRLESSRADVRRVAWSLRLFHIVGAGRIHNIWFPLLRLMVNWSFSSITTCFSAVLHTRADCFTHREMFPGLLQEIFIPPHWLLRRPWYDFLLKSTFTVL